MRLKDRNGDIYCSRNNEEGPVMRKYSLLCILAAVLMLVPAAQADTAGALYPVRKNGLWGYMNRAGEVVIEPQWAYAGAFSGDTAIAGQGETGKMKYGLIRRDGSTAVPVQYAGMEDCGAFYLIGDQQSVFDGLHGWYDKASGFFQAPRYDEVDYHPTESRLIFVSWWDGADHNYDNHHDAYVFRDGGGTAIPFDYIGEPYTSGTFHEGYAYWTIENDEGFDEFLIGLEGSRVVFPDGIVPFGEVHEGVLQIASHDDEAIFMSGLARPDGTIVFTLTENEEYLISDASEGRVFFERDAKAGILDLEGNVILPAVLDYDPGWNYFGNEALLSYRNGYALMLLCDGNNSRSYVFVDREGRIAFQMPAEPEVGVREYPCTFAMENGLAWYIRSKLLQNGDYETGYGLIRLTEHGGEFLTGPVFDRIPYHGQGLLDFSEGLMPASQNGLWGYIDGGARWIIPPQYDSAENFREGLALVEKDGKLMYIDHDGTVAWRES